jgi:hypothetical protein
MREIPVRNTVLRQFLVATALTAASGSVCAFGKDNSFPPQILTAKTITVVAHSGFGPSTYDPIKGAEFKSDAEAVLRNSGRFTLLDNPAKSDLVLLLVGGYSPGLLGFKDHIATGAVFLGGAHEMWTPVPLWIAMKTPTLRTSSAAAALTKMFLKEVNNAEQNNTGPPVGPGEEKVANEIISQDSQMEETVTSSGEKKVSSLPVEILQAKKTTVMLRIDPVAGPQGERKERDVEKEIQKWGRFSLVGDPAAADLLIVCVRLVVMGARAKDSRTYENLLIFKGGGKTPDWNRMPLWTAMQIEGLFGPAAGTQMVRRLRKQIESQGTPAGQPIPTQPRF